LIDPAELNVPAQMARETGLEPSHQTREKFPSDPTSKKGFQVAISGFRNVLSTGPEELAPNPGAKFILETETSRRELHET